MCVCCLCNTKSTDPSLEISRNPCVTIGSIEIYVYSPTLIPHSCRYSVYGADVVH